jgi:hypothetical protein
MNVHNEMSDDDVLHAVARSLSAQLVPAPPDAAAIMAASGRARRRRRLAGAGLAGVAGATALALGLTGVLSGGAGPAHLGGTIRTAAFTLVKNSNGTATLRLSLHQTFHPAELQRALARDGIPALVKTNVFCSSNPAPPLSHVVSVQLPDGTPIGKSHPGRAVPVPPDAKTVINPRALPAGTELFFDYMNNDRDLLGGILYTKSYTCHAGPPHTLSPTR